MPTYEYKCKSCGKMSEFFQAMSAKPMKQCPHCLKNTLERQIGIGAAVVFKGSGFYQTDYRSDSYKKAAEAESKGSTAPSESKPDAAPTSGTPKPEAAAASAQSNAASPSPAAPSEKTARTSSRVSAGSVSKPKAAAGGKPTRKSKR